MIYSVSNGTKAILKASKREFEILRADGNSSVIRFKDEPHREYTVKDDDLKAAADPK